MQKKTRGGKERTLTPDLKKKGAKEENRKGK